MPIENHTKHGHPDADEVVRTFDFARGVGWHNALAGSIGSILLQLWGGLVGVFAICPRHRSMLYIALVLVAFNARMALGESRMEWNVFLVESPSGRVGYLVPLSNEIVFRMGLLSQAIAGEVAEPPEQVMHGAGGIDYARFKPNPDFLLFLHAVLAKQVAHCPSVLREASRKQSGYVYIIDGRTPTPHGDVPPEDIVGMVMIKNGKPVAYKGLPAYRVFGRNGMMALEPWLEARYSEALVELIRQHAESPR
jgi:hypothetical protein